MWKILYSFFEGAWRRLFGSDVIPRLLLHIINVVATGALLRYMGSSWIQVASVGALYEAFYWSVGHGSAFDMGRDGQPSEEMIKRYKKYFWNSWCETLISPENWYTFRYDFLWMFFRYEIPAVLIALCLLSPVFSLAGLCVASIYAGCWWLHDNGYLKELGATELAEIVAGFVTGVLLCLS